MPGEVRLIDGRTAAVYTMEDIPSAHTYRDRFSDLEKRVSRIEGVIGDQLWGIFLRVEEHECRLNALALNDTHPPEYIQQLQEDMKWLKARCDDIQNIFSFDTMILNGISKQGE